MAWRHGFNYTHSLVHWTSASFSESEPMFRCGKQGPGLGDDFSHSTYGEKMARDAESAMYCPSFDCKIW